MAKKITVIGAGNGGHALAYDLSLRKAEVMLFEHPDFSKNLEGIDKTGGIEVIKSLEVEGKSVPSKMAGFAKIAHLTTDPKMAMEFSDIVFITVPAFAQNIMFLKIMPYIKDGQTIIFMPGNFGSLVSYRVMRENDQSAKVNFIEINSIPYAVRIVAPGQIFILDKKDELEAGFFPSDVLDEKLLDNIEKILDLKINPLKNVLASGLSNANMIIHVATAALGMGPMESREGNIQFYQEGCSKSVAKVLEEEDKERLEVAKAYGLEIRSFVETVNHFYSLKMKSIRDFTENSPIHNKMPADSPKSPKERYISEDCPYGLVPTYLLGKEADIDCKVMESIIRICSIYNDEDYMETGLTLEKMGLNNMRKDEIIEYIENQ